MTKTPTETELVEGPDAESIHADERPLDSVWDEYFDSDKGVTDDFTESRDQPLTGQE